MTNTKHDTVAARNFSRFTLRALSDLGLTLVESRTLPGTKGCYIAGEVFYMLSNGALRSHIDVLRIATVAQAPSTRHSCGRKDMETDSSYCSYCAML